MRRWSLSAAMLSLVALAAPAAARFGLPEPITDSARRIEDVYAQIFVAGIIMFVFVMALLVFILVRYRANGGAGRATFEKERDNIKAEATWTLIPLLIVLWVGFISYQALVDLDHIEDTDTEPYMTLHITGFQWFWQAEYDEGVTVAALPGAGGNVDNIAPIVVPADVPITFDVTGADVIHSFNIVELRRTLDAIPGTHNQLTVSLPAGEYFTQCKEHCLNPGHGYMRAIVKAVPEPEYQAWIDEQLAGAAAGLQQSAPVVADGASLTTDAPLQLARGGKVVLQVANAGDAQTFTLGNRTFDVAAGATETVEFTPEEAGALELAGSAGGSLVFDVQEPQTVHINMDNFFFDPEQIDLQAGQVYVFEVENMNTATAHNAYLGMHDSEGQRQVLWHSNDAVLPGATDVFMVVPQSAGGITLWCDIPGHFQLGMYAQVTIA